MIDFITKLLLVVGKDVILVVCDRLFKITFCGNNKGNIGKRISPTV